MDLKTAVSVSASGLRAQALRMRLIAENLANSDSIARTAGGDPYRRRVASFAAEVERGSGARGATGVRVDAIDNDQKPFEKVYRPGSPAADARGYVKLPNVNGLVETADMKAAQRAYEANLGAIEAARTLTMRTIDLLK
jgi:flagellar basal-body rod protein FlgC